LDQFIENKRKLYPNYNFRYPNYNFRYPYYNFRYPNFNKVHKKENGQHTDGDKKKLFLFIPHKEYYKIFKLTWTIEDFDGSIHASGFSLKPASIILVGGFFLSNICQWSTSLLL